MAAQDFYSIEEETLLDFLHLKKKSYCKEVLKFYIDESMQSDNVMLFNEDYVCVYSIIVDDISSDATEKDVLKYFNQFGCISSIGLRPYVNINGFNIQRAYVNFANPSAACRALHVNNPRILDREVSTEPNDSWHQPFNDKTPRPTRTLVKLPAAEGTEATTTLYAECPTLISLNNYYLDIICSQLTPGGQVRFARTCTRFTDIFRVYSKRAYKVLSLDTFSQMTMWEILDFLRFAGVYIEAIYGDIGRSRREEIFIYIARNCTNLQRVNLIDTHIEPEVLYYFVRYSPQLRELEMKNVAHGDRTILALDKLHHLEKLSLTRTGNLTGIYLYRLQNLRELHLPHSSPLQWVHILTAFGLFKNLHTLDIRCCNGLTSEFFNSLHVVCPQLEVLKMKAPHRRERYQCVVLIPRLRHLEIIYVNRRYLKPQLSLLEGLAELKAEQLTVLQIYSMETLSREHIAPIARLRGLKTLGLGCNSNMNDYALEMLQDLTNLEVLNIPLCKFVTNSGLASFVRTHPKLREIRAQLCREISSGFVAEVVHILLTERGERQRPFKIFVHKTSLNRGCIFLRLQKYKDAVAQRLIDIDFDNVRLGLEGFYDVFLEQFARLI